MRIEIKQTISEIDREFLDKKLDIFNEAQVSFTQSEKYLHLDYVAKDEDNIIGGLTSTLYYWKCLHIDIIWIDEKYRYKSLGSLLLNKVEEEAKKLGCYLIHLSTFDFQAKDFYLKKGYEIFGVLHNCPPGHKRFYLKKDLT